MDRGFALRLPCKVEDERCMEIAHGNIVAAFTYRFYSGLLKMVSISVPVHKNLRRKPTPSQKGCFLETIQRMESHEHREQLGS